MAISYVGGRTQAIAGANSGTTSVALTGLTGGSGTQPITGDLVLIGYGSGKTADQAITIADYTEVLELYSNGSGADANLEVARKFMNGTPDTTVAVPNSGSTADAVIVSVRVYRGVDTTTPLDVAATQATGTGTTNPDPAAITPVTAGAWPVVFGCGAVAGTGTTFSSSDLASFHTLNSPDTNDATIGAGHKTDWAAGAFNPAAFTGGNVAAGNSWAAVTLALRPLVSTPGDASGTVGTVTATAPDGGALAAASASGAVGTVALTAPSAAASGIGAASGSLPVVTLNAPVGTAGVSAIASGAVGTVASSPPEGAGTATATAQGSGAVVTASAPDGLAAGSGAASGEAGEVFCLPPSAGAVGSAMAAGGVGSVAMSAPTGAASEAGQEGAASGGVGTVSLAAPEALALGSAAASASGTVVQMFAPSGGATGQVEFVPHPSRTTRAAPRPGATGSTGGGSSSSGAGPQTTYAPRRLRG